MSTQAKDEKETRTTEMKISGVTYVVTVGQSDHARETLKTKLEKLILDTARKERKDLSEE